MKAAKWGGLRVRAAVRWLLCWLGWLLWLLWLLPSPLLPAGVLPLLLLMSGAREVVGDGRRCEQTRVDGAEAKNNDV